MQQRAADLLSKLWHNTATPAELEELGSLLQDKDFATELSEPINKIWNQVEHQMRPIHIFDAVINDPFKPLKRAIEESETNYFSAQPKFLLAETYAKLGKFDYAVVWCQQAVLSSKEPGGNPNKTKTYESDLISYQYRVMSSNHADSANKWLTSKVENEGLKISGKLIIAVAEGSKNYDLALILADKGLQQEPIKDPHTFLLGAKAKVYSAKGD